ncbi:sigma-54-dependent transcriptional regulator [Xylanibacter caecicola]|uniref:sigma-54-dependent transcriptional regulator n=1 Tax=Xylanibacter caecicola TaxID=2736294 RepID=UPI0025894184|nr:sigma-54 dependent transcriptional regulator [Xylanibacter caecicola]
MKNARILLVEDDLTFATMLQTFLGKKGFSVDRTGDVAHAMKMMQGGNGFDLVLSDLRLPGRDGLELLRWMRDNGFDIPFIVMTNYAEVQNAVLAMKSGASDYISKPVQPDILLQKIGDALASAPVSMPVCSKPVQPFRPGLQYMEGTSDAASRLYDHVSLVAPTMMSVLILGASGTGKEHVARLIHERSKRAARPFVAIDCGSVSREVSASEFFGYVKGAFTGAVEDKKGAFVEADGGTLFLDEVGNLGYEVQVQLLRAIQEHRVRPVGTTKETDVDIRLVCATNENLAEAVARGDFREDLYHRISEFTIYMPELKDRGKDLFLFADYFLKQANSELERDILGFDAKAAEMMARHTWPGNLRELKNVVRRAALLAGGRYICPEDLRQSIRPVEPEIRPLHSEPTEIEQIKAALRATGGNKTRTAQLLGIDRKTLYNKLARFGMDI